MFAGCKEQIYVVSFTWRKLPLLWIEGGEKNKERKKRKEEYKRTEYRQDQDHMKAPIWILSDLGG